MDLEMPYFWPSQPGEFKNQHLLLRQQVSKNHIIDGPPCIKRCLLIKKFVKGGAEPF
jgi:hypothetical protein